MLRNIAAGMPGCECKAGATCVCRSGPILGEGGCYSIELVRKHDAAWGEMVGRCLDWEVLSHTMVEEEPDAARLIAVALNKKNGAAMKTGHTEIMKAVALCKPDPKTLTVHVCTVRDKMVHDYGAAVDDPYFHHAFRYVLDAGGYDSKHMEDMNLFTKTDVNPTLRPVSFPSMKIASMKWAWRPEPVRGWCVLPISIQHRLEADHKLSMKKQMEDIEEALGYCHSCAATVVAKSSEGAKLKLDC